MGSGWVNTCDCMSYALSATTRPYWEKLGHISPELQYGTYQYACLEQVKPFIKVKLIVSASIQVELIIKPFFQEPH